MPCEHPDVNLPAGWHLNATRVPVPPPPTGRALEVEAQRRRRILPDRMRCNQVYTRLDFWATFLAWEHEARRACSYRGDWQPEEEEEDDDAYDWDDEMEEDEEE